MHLLLFLSSTTMGNLNIGLLWAILKNVSLFAKTPMDRLEEQLHRLVDEACGHPLGSSPRQKLLTRIIRLTGSKLWRENTPYYQDALQQTWLYFCQNVCGGYDPTRGSVITWLNSYLRWRLRDHQNNSPIYKPALGYGGDKNDPIDLLVAPPDIPPILETVRLWVKADSDGELGCTYIQGRPEVNCQVLILKRLPPEVSWKELSVEFALPVSTLSSFYQRQCLPRLRKFAEEEGYL